MIHISERLPQKAELLCPFCKEPVTAKKGNEKQHHFAHKPGYGENCSPTRDELLHEGAKAFLLYAIQHKMPLNIIVPDMSKLPPEFVELFEFTSVTGLTIPITSLPGAGFEDHRPEKSIESIRPDITTYDWHGKPAFAWEIFVTHALESGKKAVLDKLDCGYIELKPVPLEPSGYTFFLESFEGFDLLKKKDLLDFVYNSNKQDLLKLYETSLNQEYRSKIFQELHKKSDERIAAEVQKRIADYKQHQLEELQNKVFCQARTEASSKYQKRIREVDLESITKWLLSETNLYSKIKKRNSFTVYSQGLKPSQAFFSEPLEHLEFKSFYSIKVNKKYDFDSLSGFFAQLVKDSIGFFDLKGLLNSKKKEIIGFDFFVENAEHEKQHERVMLKGYSSQQNAIAIESVRVVKRNNANDYCNLITSNDEIFIQNFGQLLHDLLLTITKHYRCEAVLQKRAEGQVTIVGITIHDLFLKEIFNKELQMVLQRAVTKIIESA